jgi:hypothetical protein
MLADIAKLFSEKYYVLVVKTLIVRAVQVGNCLCLMQPWEPIEEEISNFYCGNMVGSFGRRLWMDGQGCDIVLRWRREEAIRIILVSALFDARECGCGSGGKFRARMDGRYVWREIEYEERDVVKNNV